MRGLRSLRMLETFDIVVVVVGGIIESQKKNRFETLSPKMLKNGNENSMYVTSPPNQATTKKPIHKNISFPFDH
jgi:mevalonate kinase